MNSCLLYAEPSFVKQFAYQSSDPTLVPGIIPRRFGEGKRPYICWRRNETFFIRVWKPKSLSREVNEIFFIRGWKPKSLSGDGNGTFFIRE